MLEGTPYEIGFQHGSKLKDRIGDCIEEYKKLFQVYAQMEWDTCVDLARSYKHIIQKFSPDMIKEMQGIADGAECTFDEILALNVQNETMFMYHSGHLNGIPRGCTGIAAIPERTETGHMIHGQNMDFEPGHEKFMAVFYIIQDNKPDVLTVAEVGTIGKIGMNSLGIALTANAIETPGVPLGLPANAITRGILNSRNIAHAIEIIARNPCACALNYMISNNDGEVVNVEVVLDDYDVLYPDDGLCVHGNHYLSQRLLTHHKDTMRLICTSSHVRTGRAKRILNNLKHPLTIDDFKKIFADHADYPESICWHPNTAITHETARIHTAGSIIMDTTKGEMLVTQGNPCSNPYQLFKILLSEKEYELEKW